MASLKSQKIKFGLAAGLWAVLLVMLSLEPDAAVESLLPADFLKNLAHAVTYGILAFLLCFFLRFKRSLLGFKMKDFNIAGFSFFLTLAWGGLTEIIQRWTPDRTASLKDLAYDGAGASAAILCFFVYSNLPDRHPCQPKTR